MEKAVGWAVLPNGYIVSTIKRDEKMKAVDNMIALISSLLVADSGRADLSEEGDYETMVFPEDNEELAEIDFARYASEEEAISGHKAMVRRWLEMPAGISRLKEEV